MTRRAPRFALRLAVAVGALAAAAIGLLGLLSAEELRSSLTGDLTRALETEARLGARTLGASAALRAGAFEPEARALGEACGCRATLIAPDGRLAGDSDLDAAGLERAENHATRPEVVAAAARGSGSAVRRSVTVGVDLLYAAAPVGGPGAGRGVVRLAVPLTRVHRRVAQARLFVLWSAAGALAFALALAWLLARAAGRPLEEMAAVARRLAAGDFAARARGPLGGDERELLGDTLNALAERVQRTVGELSRDRGRLAAVLDQMEEGVVAVDAQGAVLLVNPALSRLLGIDPERARGRGHLESLRHRGLAELLEEVRVGGKPAARELRLVTPEERVFDAHAAPLAQDGRPAGALVVLHDVTRLRRLEQARRDLVANVSHELRTPLASIKGYAETLRDGAITDKENRLEFVKVIEEEAERLSKLVDDLLDLSAIESGHRPPRLAPVPLEELLKDAARRFAHAAAQRELKLDVLPPGAGLAASCDREQIGQVLANLVENAIKYNEAGGAVELGARREGGDVVVWVRDTGPGIPPADQARLFERFYRVDKARSREAGGTGLGLAIVKHLVEAHGGRVAVESRQPGGSTFSFTLKAS